MLQDLPSFVLSVLGLSGLVGAAEVAQRAGWCSAAATRRLVHAGTGLFVVLTPYLFHTPHLVYVLAAAFAVLNGAALWGGWLRGIHAVGRKSLGTVIFPLALLLALALTWSADPDRIFALQVAFLILACSDPLASWVGMRSARHGEHHPGRGRKSRAGTLAFLLSAFGLGCGVMGLMQMGGQIDWTGAEVVGASLLVAAAAAAAERLGSGGWDNLLIVLACIVVLVPYGEAPELRGRLLAAGGAGLVFGLASYHVRFLTLSGAVAGGLLAWTLVGLGGWAWAVPALTFFLLSSLLSRVGRRRKQAAEARSEKGNVRDAGQVAANGGVGWALLVLFAFFPSEFFYWGFLGAFAAAAADTWATELGTLAPSRPRLITTGARVPPGTSGAVSAAGTLGALLGAAAVWASAVPFAAEALEAPLGLWGAAVVGGGVAGSLVDSLLGATVQACYRERRSGMETERPATGDAPNPLVRGWQWMDNDRVNLIGTLAGALLALGAALAAGDAGY